MTRYILLRDNSGNWCRSCERLSESVAPQDPTAAGAPRIEVADLSPQDLRAVCADPHLLCLQRAMPTRLVAPAAMDELRNSDTVPGWGLRATGADQSAFSGAGVRMAVLDTGIDASHPAFAGVKTESRDFAGTGVADANGHGTHMAATVLGRDIGGQRIGVARGITDLLVGKALADNGIGRSEDFLQAMLWALQKKADILCFALAFDTRGQTGILTEEGYPQPLATLAAVHAYRGNLRICDVILQMFGKGQAPLLLGAAGNDSLRTIAPEFETGLSAPASAAGVLAIGACGRDEEGLYPAPFNNAGAAAVAPGVGILSAGLDDGLRSLNGSSMGLAHAAGIGALWVEQMRNTGETVTARSLAAKLVRTASMTPLGPRGSYVDCGHGVIQAPPPEAA